MSWENFSVESVFISFVKAIIILLFAYTATDKLLHYTVTVGQMNQQLLPLWLKPYLPLGIPILELLIALSLAIFSNKLWPWLAAASLMLAFTAYVGIVHFGDFPRVPCSCGGIISSLSWSAHFYLNLSLSMLITVVIYMKRH